jgi:molybdate transport system ATP-binding protein
VPVYGERRENCIRFAKYEKAELPFEVNYYVAPEKEEWKREEMLSWFVQREDWPLLREKGNPDYLQFQEDKILILREGL